MTTPPSDRCAVRRPGDGWQPPCDIDAGHDGSHRGEVPGLPGVDRKFFAEWEA